MVDIRALDASAVVHKVTAHRLPLPAHGSASLLALLPQPLHMQGGVIHCSKAYLWHAGMAYLTAHTVGRAAIAGGAGYGQQA